MLVVGISCGKADVQGTRCNSGTAPAAVTECLKVRPISWPLSRKTCRPSCRHDDEKAGQTELGSQKTYQRGTCGSLRGADAAKAWNY